jgi:hypothetical protein
MEDEVMANTPAQIYQGMEALRAATSGTPEGEVNTAGWLAAADMRPPIQ